jgi:hypothetical protein
MKADDLAAAVREGQGKFRVEKVVIDAGSSKIRGKGLLIVSSEDFELEMTVAPNAVPRRDKIVWTERDFWHLTGVIEDDLMFRAEHVSTSGYRESWRIGRKPRLVQTFSFHTVELFAVGFDALSAWQRRKLTDRPSKRRPKPRHPSVEFAAVLFRCKPTFLNAGTTTDTRNKFLGKRTSFSIDSFVDRGRDFDFALIKDREDLRVHFRSKRAFRSVTEADDLRRFHALLAAIGFTHGFNPWPYRIQYWRNGRMVFDRLTPTRELTQTIHSPFSTAIGRSEKTTQNNYESPIRLAARFFDTGSVLGKKTSQLLFLFREAGGKGVHLHVETLALCSIFEGLVDLLFAELSLEDELRARDSHYDLYLSIRDRLVRRFSAWRTSAKPVFQRLAGSLGHAEPFRVKDKFKAICQHFELDYDRDMKPHFEAWAIERGALSHGDFKFRDTDFTHQGLIAGAMNIFVLKAMGYSGPVRVNAFAEANKTHRRI